MKTPEPGIHNNVPLAEYLAWDAVNQSGLKAIIDSPAHCLHAMTAERAPTDALLAGTALHVAALEPDRFEREYGVWNKQRRKGKKAFGDAAAEAEKMGFSLYRSDWNVPAMVRRLRDDQHSGALLANLHGRAEVSILWDDESGVRCKARIDGLFPSLAWDLKSIARVPTARNCAGAALKYRYPFQAAFTLRGLRALGEKDRTWALVFQEKDAPHSVNTFWLAGPILDYGASQVNRALAKYRHCMATGSWPGPGAEGTTTMDLPEWAAKEEGVEFQEEVTGEW